MDTKSYIKTVKDFDPNPNPKRTIRHCAERFILGPEARLGSDKAKAEAYQHIVRTYLEVLKDDTHHAAIRAASETVTDGNHTPIHDLSWMWEWSQKAIGIPCCGWVQTLSQAPNFTTTMMRIEN